MLQSVMSNATSANKSTVSVPISAKLDCAKDCPCGVPVIPVPDQWLEVMVTGGFKVWHIIFIIIAFVVTIVVVYCCFHRCRIPRTKQEIEADLMRTNITNKFREYLQELPNEPTTFLEALRKVHELEEKCEQNDAQLARDAGARKRLGWRLKLKGKAGEKDSPAADNKTAADTGDNNNNQPADEPQVANGEAAATQEEEKPKGKAEPEVVKPKKSSVDLANDTALLLPPAEAAEKESAGDLKAGSGDQAAAAKKPVRRRKQKPNLSRTKRAHREPIALDINKGDQHPLEISDNERPGNDELAPPTSTKIQVASSAASDKHPTQTSHIHHPKEQREHRKRNDTATKLQPEGGRHQLTKVTIDPKSKTKK